MAGEARLIANAMPEPVTTCSCCGERRPLGDFRLRSRQTGQRRHQCRACWRDYFREYRARRRDEALEHVNRDLAAQTDARKVAVLAKLLLRRFGGPVRLADLLHQHTLLLAAQKPGSQQTLRALWAILRLVGAVSDG